MKKSTLALAIVFGLGLTGIVVHNASATCVELYVDYGPLNSGAVTEECIPVESSISALELLQLAGFSTEGTQEYGNAVICRVNNFPDATAESCLVMPPAEAYWATLIKEHQIVPLPFGIAGAWGWAQTGADEIYLEPGDSLGLVFADNGEVKFP